MTTAEAAENGPDKVTTEDAEARARRALEGRAEVRRYIGAAMDGGAVDGAEAEYNAALGMGAGSFPLRLLAPARETRATTDTEAGVMAQPDVAWTVCFAESCRHEGWGVVSVQVKSGRGQAYPGDDGGRESAAQRGRKRGRRRFRLDRRREGDQADPERRAGRFQRWRTPRACVGLEDALRRDLRMPRLREGSRPGRIHFGRRRGERRHGRTSSG